ncbi:MAG TPA: TRIC cation channel family protein, partial [Tepidiformaceae bacterium]|nr:TRIC cation channel family protein [Tepidiformaceae bacterium]
MNIDAFDIITVLDRIGIVAFAIAGVQVGVRRRLDIFGLLVMGVVSATGGGAMRDVALGRLPLVLDRVDYLLWAGAASSLGIALAWRSRALPPAVLLVADSVGLGAFAVAGAFAAISAGLELPAVVLIAVVTATGGGVIRDLLADRVPLVLRAEVNATAAALGGIAVWAIEPASTGAAALVGLT